jgi:hypothetical protein
MTADREAPVSETDPDAVRDAPQTSNSQPPADQVAPAPEPYPGNVNDEHGHVAVAAAAAAGTSEETPKTTAVRTAVAQPGKPDGEVAT